MRKYDKAFVIVTSCILKHASLQNDNLVSIDTTVFFFTKSAMRFLEKALSWNVQKPPESEMRNLLGGTFIGTRITLHPCPVCRWVFDTEHPVFNWIFWRLTFSIQKALPGGENVNIRQSKKPNLLGPCWKLQHSVFLLQKLAQFSAEAYGRARYGSGLEPGTGLKPLGHRTPGEYYFDKCLFLYMY